ATGKLVAWVKVPTLPSGSNTDLYLYYGNPSASNMQDRHGTWSNGYSEVWHLGESSGNVFDSAPAGYTGTVSGTLNRNVAGQVDGADEFLGPSTSTWLTLNDGDLGNNAPFTMSAWFYVDTPTSWTGIVTKGREQGVDWVGLWAAGSQYQAGWDWSGTPGKGGNLVGSNLISHSWYYGVLSFDGTNRFLYLNGSLNAGPSAGYYNKMNLTWTSVGNDRASTSANSFDGIIDEVRVSSVNRSAGWIRTEYNNQNSPGTFFSSIGSEEASPCGGGSGTCTGVVSVDATSSGQNTTPTSGITISHTTSGDYRLMLVGVSISPSGQAATQYVSSLTYNGVALTRVGTVLNSDDARVEIWKLVSPDTGTHNVVIGFNAPLTLPAAAGVMTFTGVDQTTVNSSWATATGNSDTLLDLTIPSTTGELAYGVITNEYNSIITDPGQTERWNVHINNPVEYMNGAGSTKAGAASVNMRWTFSSTYNHQAAAGISIRPCSSITPTPTTLLPTPTPTPRSDWYPGCGWSYRKNITIDKAKVTGSQSNFPVLISIPADTDLMNHARTDGFDILFTSDDGQTTIPYEREGYDSATGALTAWVNVPSLSSASNTTIYMYYGFPSSPDASHPELTWDGNYMGVWHMSAALADSTTYANTGTNQGSTDVSGLIGRARNFAGGSKQYIDVTKIYPKGTGLNITGSGVTIEAWIKAASWADWYSLGYIAGRDDWANNWRNGSVLRVGHNPPHTGNGAVSFNIGNGTKGGTGWTEAYTRGSMTLNTWYFVAGTYNGSYAAAFINGTSLVNMTYPLQNPAGAAINASNYNTNLGDSAYSRLNEGASGGRYFDGIIDEARISNIARSDSWISTEYANQKSPATFEYIGKEETYLCGGVPAPVYVQSKSQSYGAVSQAQITLPGTSTTGDLLVLSFGYDNSALTYFSVSDSKNNAWAQAVGPTDVAGGRAYTLYAK
ncbi:MAG TPA: DUF2341 domain-containing protein, partial [Methanomicrobiales archaeon]|nr:DUF2341 domain-containing protein [Methanomicrobiales archaeon]